MTASPAKAMPARHGRSAQERRDRLSAGAERLASRRSAWVSSPQVLLWLSASLMTAGPSLVLLGWLGVARSTIVEAQLPYLVSGGLLGLAVTMIGSVTFFVHWLTAAHATARAAEAARQQDHQELLVAVRELSDALRREEVSHGAARGSQSERPLRRSSRSS